MKKQELFEEFRRNILSIIERSEDEITIDEVNALIEKCFYDFMQIYNYNGFDFETIQEYLNGNKEYAKREIRKICENRKDEIMSEVNYIVNKIENQMEEKETNEKEDDGENKYNVNIDRIEKVSFDNEKNSFRILETVIDALQDAKTRASKIIESRGFSDDDIEKINLEVRSYINRLELREQDEIQEVLEEDKGRVLSRIEDEYEQFMAFLENVNEKQEMQKNDDKTKFRDELKSVAPSLEEQKEYVDKVLEKQDNTEKRIEPKSLPDDIF